jgi:hypothetical protein
MAIKGYAAPEVAEAYARARELCEQVGDTPLAPTLSRAWPCTGITRLPPITVLCSTLGWIACVG